MKAILSSLLLAPLVIAAPVIFEDDDQISLKEGTQDILVYHKSEMEPPKVAGEKYRRSGFIHPLKTPNGGVVTGIHPDDHYHHMGIWHAWVKTQHGNDQPDFWNIGKGGGLVRFSKVTDRIRDDGKVGFKAEQEQVAFKGESKKETVVLKEEFTVTAAQVGGVNVIDYIVKQTNVSGVALEMPAYRYGGPLAYRGPHSWNKKNSEYLTSEGKTREDSHTTRAKWCAVYGPTETGEATLAFLCHPENFDAPQRLRTWPGGKMFLNWAAAQENGFTIHAGDSITWSYRLITADGKLTAEQIEAQWKKWANK